MEDFKSLMEYNHTLIQLRNKFFPIRTGDFIPLKSSNPAVCSAMRKDENRIFLILAKLSKEAITKYNIALMDAGLAESAYSVETVFGADQGSSLEGSGEAFPEYKPFENPNPYAIYVLKINPT